MREPVRRIKPGVVKTAGKVPAVGPGQAAKPI